MSMSLLQIQGLKEETPNIFGFRTENRTEQTRFHFRMDLCMGCHACEVACAEQNGLPADTLWRRVGEVQSGVFPDTKSLFISSGCNHCLDAACMKGCPVDAYQVNHRGIVVHLDDVCIGCQYCTWNCPYDVPVFQKDRKIVTKCDLCTNRLDEGLDPACVQACPARAILVETVPLQEVFENHIRDGCGPDMPDPSITMPSTRITLPKDMKMEEFKKVDREFVRPQEPHTPLIWMTVLTQLGFGGFLAVFLVDLLRSVRGGQAETIKALGWLAPTLIVIIMISLGASTFHLGRPAYAYRAMKNWRTSWLSREILSLSLFAGVALMYSAFLFLTEGLNLVHVELEQANQLRMFLGWLTVISGVVGIYCSSMLYRVPARPAWDMRKTTFDFFFVSFILGSACFVFSVGVLQRLFPEPSVGLYELSKQMSLFAFFALLFKMMQQSVYMRRWSESDVFELSACAGLYRDRFFRLRFVRNVMVIVSLICLLLLASGGFAAEEFGFLFTGGLTLVLLIGICLIHRYLFFVTVVPRNIPGNFLVSAYEVLK